MPKGEKVLAQSKRIAPPPISKNVFFQFVFKEVFQLVSYFYIIFKLVWPLSKIISKTLLNTKRRILLGGVLFSQRKSIWNRGEISNLENASRNLIHISFDYLQKTLKRNFQIICKNKTSGASVVQNVKIRRKHPCISYEMNIGLIPSNLCTYLMQTNSILHLYICFGLCWHQSPKRGRLKGK
jgi:hypothetical protein